MNAESEIAWISELQRRQDDHVAEIWQQLLGIEKVGIHDNFFELGGHSLLATQVIARLRKAFSVEFPMASLFERPTVHLLSKMMLDEENDAPAFLESSKRGQKRKEKKRRKMMKKKEKTVS